MTPGTQATLGTIGIWLLLAGGLLIIAELVLTAVWGVAMGRRMRSLTERISSERAGLEADLERLRRAIEETQALWRPYGRVLRTLNHPLLLAVLASLRRRMAAR